MKNISGNKWVPDDGYAYISNGAVWTDSIFLGAKDDIVKWHDTNEEPLEPEEEPTAEEVLDILLGGDTE